jgi:F-type H+-transporting ATPase subunit delta
VISRDIARRYAEALYDLAEEEGLIERVAEELAALVEAVTGTPEARIFLVNPLVPRARKMAFIDAAFPALCEPARGLLGIVIRNGREDHLGLIHEEYDAVCVDRAGIQRVTVSSASPLSATERSRINDRLSTLLKRPVELVETVEADLIGGARIEIRGVVLDGTLRGRLDRLFARLEG